MADLSISFSSVSLPTNTSSTLTVYEDIGNDGTGANSVTLPDGSTFDYDNSASTALSDGTTTYTLSGFDAAGGNGLKARLEPDTTDITTTASASEAVTVTPAAVVVNKVSMSFSAATAGVGANSAEKITMVFSPTNSYTDWTIDGQAPSSGGGGGPSRVLIGHEHTHDTLRLTYRTPLSAISQLRAFNDNAGDIRKLTTSDGGWDVVDMSDSGAQMLVSPPSVLTPTFVEDTFYLRDYSERPVSTLGNDVDVTLTLVRDGPRDPEDTGDVLTESQDSDDWLLEFQHGTIATPLVAEASQQAQTDIRLQMSLTEAEAEVVLENPTYLDAVSVETVPDGDDFVRDNNPDNRNTVTLTRPTDIDSEYLPTEGDYVIRRWTVRNAQPRRYDVSMTVRKT